MHKELLCMADEFATLPASVHEQVSMYITIQAALDDTHRLRKAGNQDFLEGSYCLSAENYAAAQQYIIRAQILSELSPLRAFESAIAKAQVKLSWSEVINWLLYTNYTGTVSHFQRALIAADRALRLVDDHAGVWNLNVDALEKLILWRSLACKGLGQSVRSLDLAGVAEVLDTTLDFDIITDDETAN
ncbi:MAG: hypothetical protein Q9212_001936 [Teloschistes hypoglaucus]